MNNKLFFPVLLIATFFLTSSFAISTSQKQVLGERAEKAEKVFQEEEELETPDLEDEKEIQVKEGTEAAKTKLKIGKAENKYLFFESKFGAESDHPVSVNRNTGQLTITTPAGTKAVTVLPDAAVEHMLAAKVISRLSEATASATPSPEVSISSVAKIKAKVKLEVGEDGKMQYVLQGIKTKKLLGLFSIDIPKTITVSATDGSLKEVKEDLISQILEAISI